jgi:hypothetical protein
MALERRDLIQILGAGLAGSGAAIGQKGHQHARVPPAPYTPRALTAGEYRDVDNLVEIILPADETSPGAHDAGVARYIDLVLMYGNKETMASWRSGLEAVNAVAREAHGRPFSEITREQATEIVGTMAANETNPVTELDHFFVAVKRLALEAFYLSSAGKQSLGYKGDTAILNFRGCTGHQHEV